MLRNGWERLTCDLNRKSGGKWIHVWVKRERQTFVCDVAATDSFSSDEQMLRAGYIRMDEDTNRGADGNYVFIWYRQTIDPQRALTDLQVSTNSSERQVLAQRNDQKVNINLNEGTDSAVYLWYKIQVQVRATTPSRSPSCFSTQRLSQSMRVRVSMLSEEISTQATKAGLSTCVIFSESLRKLL